MGPGLGMFSPPSMVEFQPAVELPGGQSGEAHDVFDYFDARTQRGGESDISIQYLFVYDVYLLVFSDC